MANRRPDYIMLAAMQLHGFLPQPIAEGIIELYSSPAPVDYESALDAVRTKVVEVIASGALQDLEGAEGMPEPAPTQLRAVPNTPEGADDHDPDLCPDCEFERHNPPAWMLNCFQFWDMITLDD